MPPSPAPAQSPPASGGVTIVEGPAPAPPPAPTRSIQVSQMPGMAEPPKPPARGTAMDRLRQDLAKKAKTPGAASDTQTPPAKPEAPKPATQSTETPPSAPDQSPGSGDPSQSPDSETPGEGQQQQPQKPAATEQQKGKTNPWKLVDTYKQRLATLEKQVAEAKTSALAEEAKKEYLDRITKLEDQNKQYAEEIRYVNYTKHPEFVEKYQKPYEAAWKRAVSELSEINLTDPNSGQARPATPQDLMALVNLPLGKAREVANTLFGDFADDVMGHRKEIRNLFDAQNQAIENARKEGADREKHQRELSDRQQREVTDTIVKTWEAENSTIQQDPQLGRFLTPSEGDEEGNTRLQKGFELVDKAFSENPLDPRLTPEQREVAVKRHVAVRNRAAAFGRLVQMVGKLEAQNAALMKELEQVKGGTPQTGGQPSAGGQPAAPATARESVFAALRAKAKNY